MAEICSGNPKKRFEKAEKNNPRKLVRDEIIELDQTLLKLLLKRFNLLTKIRSKKQASSDDEKIIREAWLKNAAKSSQDPALSTTFFTLLQTLAFRPKPEKNMEGKPVRGNQRREGFNLNPPHLPVSLEMAAPISSRLTRIWLYLAAVSGTSLGLSPILPSESILNCMDILRKLGAVINNEVDNAGVVEGLPIAAPDIVLHAGRSKFNFYMILAHYICRPSKVKIAGAPPLSLKDFRPLASFLPSLGCRMTFIIPRTSSLPVRIECAGQLPAIIKFPSSISSNFILLLIISALFYQSPVSFDLNDHPDRKNLIEVVTDILNQTGAVWLLENFVLTLDPGSPVIPSKPSVPMDFGIAAFLLAFAEPLRGSVILKGNPGNFSRQKNLLTLLHKNGCNWKVEKDSISNTNTNILNAFNLTANDLTENAELPEFSETLLTALACCAALSGGSATLPPSWHSQPEIASFLEILGLNGSGGNGEISKNERESGSIPWLAPTSAWAMGLALAACANTGQNKILLANPGIVADWWAGFWNIYNGLPNPMPKIAPKPPVEIKKGRRILTNSIAKLPPEEN